MAKDFGRKDETVHKIQELADWTNDIGDIIIKDKIYAYIRVNKEYKPCTFPMKYDYNLPKEQWVFSDHWLDEKGVHNKDNKNNTLFESNLVDGRLEYLSSINNTKWNAYLTESNYSNMIDINGTYYALTANSANVQIFGSNLVSGSRNFVLYAGTEETRIGLDNDNYFANTSINTKTGYDRIVNNGNSNNHTQRFDEVASIDGDAFYNISNNNGNYLTLETKGNQSNIDYRLSNNNHLILGLNDNEFMISGSQSEIEKFRMALDNLLGVTAKYNSAIQHADQINTALTNSINSLEARIANLEARP